VTVQRPVVKAAEKRARENESDAKAGTAVVASLQSKIQNTGGMTAAMGVNDSVEQAMTSQFQELLETANNARRN
jgi:hypothetical protein